MAIADAIPELMSARLLEYLTGTYVYAARTNRTWEPDLRQDGDRIELLGADASAVSVQDYVPNATITYGDASAGSPTVLQIDFQKYWAQKIDDIHRVQARPALLDAAVQIAADKLAAVIDDKVRTDMTAGVSSLTATLPGASAQYDLDTAISDEHLQQLYDAFAAAHRVMDEAKIPASRQRWAIVGPRTRELLSVAAATGYSADAINAESLRNGFSGQFAGFTIYTNHGQSQTTTSGTTVDAVILGTDYATAMAEQIRSAEMMRLETTFADAVRGLYVAGVKVIETAGLLRLNLRTEKGVAYA